MNKYSMRELWIDYFGELTAALMIAQVEHIEGIRNHIRLPATDKAVTAMVMENFRLVATGEESIPARFVVRGVPLRGGNCWTVGVFLRKEHAEEFKAFWGTFVYTEVHIVELHPGDDLYKTCLNAWEENWAKK
jgi:hypothetical protein